MKVSIIGDGNVGQALARGLEKAGHTVTTTGNDPARVKELASSGDVVILAVPFGALDEVAATIGRAADGKARRGRDQWPLRLSTHWHSDTPRAARRNSRRSCPAPVS